MTYSPRNMQESTLVGAAEHYMKEWNRPSVPHAHAPGVWIGGRTYVMNNLYNMTYKDEHEFMMSVLKRVMDPHDYKDLMVAAAARFTPRQQGVFEAELEKRLAIRPDGTHIPGKIGSVSIGTRKVGTKVLEVPHYKSRPRDLKQRLLFINGTLMDRVLFRSRTTPKLVEMRYITRPTHWQVYAGEIQEREAESGVADPLPPQAEMFSLLPNEAYATNPKMSNVGAITACDALVDQFETLGSTAGTINGRTGTQPADVDATETGTLLFTLSLNLNDAFGGAVDDTGKATATANTITDDTSADDTNTLGYCRCASTGTGADNLFDGEAGTSASDFNFNTLSIVSGTTVSMSSFTISVSE